MPEYAQFIKKIHKRTGIDLSFYREAQMKRRLTSLYAGKGYSNFEEFYRAIQADRLLMNEFLDRLTINVSAFYRNVQHWAVLQEKILPELLSRRTPPTVWSAACAAGEEPYSLAIALSRYLPLDEISIIATDIDTTVLRKAAEGVYAADVLTEIPDDSLDLYFERSGSAFSVKESLKKTVSYHRHNLLDAPIGSDFDLIVCRNVMIYFTEEAKDMVCHSFSKALRPGGFLFVGITEQIQCPERYGFKEIYPLFYRKQ